MITTSTHTRLAKPANPDVREPSFLMDGRRQKTFYSVMSGLCCPQIRHLYLSVSKSFKLTETFVHAHVCIAGHKM